MKTTQSLLAVAAAALLALPNVVSAQPLISAPGPTGTGNGLNFFGLSGNTGLGFGSSGPLLTLGNGTNTSGCVGPAGFTCPTGFGTDAFANGTNLYSSALFGSTPLTASNFGLILNTNQSGNGPIGVQNLQLLLFPTNPTPANPNLAINLVTTPFQVTGLPGTGNGGIVFGLTGTAATQFGQFVQANQNFNIGLAANLSGGTAGRESFLITNAVASSVVPEPSTYALMATGLLGLGFAARRRRKV